MVFKNILEQELVQYLFLLLSTIIRECLCDNLQQHDKTDDSDEKIFLMVLIANDRQEYCRISRPSEVLSCCLILYSNLHFQIML